jgi:hypothetical protein
MRTTWSRPRCLALLVLAVGSAGPVCAWERVTLVPVQDNTLYETGLDTDEQKVEVSNGAGSQLFIGRTGLDAAYKRRRALLRFDIAGSLPDDATIVWAELSLRQTKAAPGSPPAVAGLHRVLAAWGEGASNAIGPEGQGAPAEAGDATWHHRLFPDALWASPGGEFEVTASATTTVGQALETFTWSCTPGLLADLDSWRNNPVSNHGWILVGGEAAGFSAHRFASRENATVEHRPMLTVVYRELGDLFRDGFETGGDCVSPSAP